MFPGCPTDSKQTPARSVLPGSFKLLEALRKMSIQINAAKEQGTGGSVLLAQAVFQ